MTFSDLKSKLIDLAVVDGVYKTGKLNSKQAIPLKTALDAWEFFGLPRQEKIYCLLNDIVEPPSCQCGQVLKPSWKQQYCSPKCAGESSATLEKRRQTTLNKYGVAHIMQTVEVKNKVAETNLQKYGRTASWAAPEVRAKMIATVVDKYGVDNVAKAKSSRQKSSEAQLAFSQEQKEEKQRKTIETNLQKYGIDRPQRKQTLKDQLAQAIRENWAEKNLRIRLTEIEADTNVVKLDSTWNGLEQSYAWKHLDCGREFEAILRSTRGILCPFCRRKSKVQEFVESIVQDSGLDFTVEDRKQIAPYELDVLIESKQLAIEVNGVYWHHDLSQQKPLLWKTEQFAGQLLHFWDFEIQEKPEIIRTMIKSKLGVLPKIFARKTNVVEVKSGEARQFFEANHLQGHAQASVYLGLEHEGDLIALASFGRPRFTKEKVDWELIRFASAGVTVVGGLSKLLKKFAQGREGQKLVSFADKRFSVGNAYLATGFNLIAETKPGYFYVKGDQRLSRYGAMKSKLETIVQDFDPALSEIDLMRRDGWLRCFDCGNLKFEKIL